MLACTQTANQLLVLNADLVNAGSYSDFYYDPHTKHCTTKQLRLLKSWCGSKHLVGKVLEMDFIHTCDGHPVHIAYGDSYKDLRERFIGTIINASYEITDSDDIPHFSVTEKVQCMFFVTGDKELWRLNPIGAMRVLSP